MEQLSNSMLTKPQHHYTTGLPFGLPFGLEFGLENVVMDCGEYLGDVEGGEGGSFGRSILFPALRYEKLLDLSRG